MSSKSKKLLTIVGGFLIGGYLAFQGGNQLLTSRKLAKQGLTVEGTVTDAEEHKSRKLRLRTYYLTVTYQPEGATEAFSERVEVSEATFDAARAAGVVKVYYLADNPSVCAAGETVNFKYGTLLTGIALLGAAVFLSVFFREAPDLNKGAEAIEDNLKPLTLTKHEYANVDGKDFKHLDQKFYQRAQRFLEARRFKCVGDVENVTLRKAHKQPRTFLRVFVHPGSCTMAALYHFCPAWSVRVLGVKEVKVLDLETWFADGTFVCTGNAEMAGKLKSPPEIDELQMPALTQWEHVIEAHEKRINLHLERHPGVMPVAVKDLADVLHAQHELQRIKGQHRQAVGVTRDELENIMGGKSPELDQVHAAYAERRSQQPVSTTS